MSELEITLRIAVAGLAGLAVGFEREWSGHATGPSARFAGIRTFLLIGLAGGIAGWLIETGAAGTGTALIIAVAALVVVAYGVAASRGGASIDGTTEAAALVVLGLGLLAGRGEIRIASGFATLTVVALGEKDAIRRLVGRIDALEMRAALQFAVLALVVLPVLPAGPYGPYDAIRPRMLWSVVLIFLGLNFIGYGARRVLGDRRGYEITGALGGLVSSTAVTLAFARRSRTDPSLASSLAAGALAASVVMIPRVIALTVVLGAGFTPIAVRWLVPILGAGLVVWVIARRHLTDGAGASPAEAANPLRLGEAIRMTVAFQIVLVGIAAFRDWFGDPGVMAGAALAGLTDVDALTLSMTRLAGDPEQRSIAARALALGLVANSVLKGAMALAVGGASFRRRVSLGLLAMAAAGVAGLWLIPRD